MRFVGTKIKSEREKKLLTMQQVADMLGIDVSRYRKIESGACAVTIYDLTKIAECIGIPLSTFD